LHQLIAETNTRQSVRSGMQNRIFGPYLAAIDRIIISLIACVPAFPLRDNCIKLLCCSRQPQAKSSRLSCQELPTECPTIRPLGRINSLFCRFHSAEIESSSVAGFCTLQPRVWLGFGVSRRPSAAFCRCRLYDTLIRALLLMTVEKLCFGRPCFRL
jgi:hypothetical protein